MHPKRVDVLHRVLTRTSVWRRMCCNQSIDSTRRRPYTLSKSHPTMGTTNSAPKHPVARSNFSDNQIDTRPASAKHKVRRRRTSMSRGLSQQNNTSSASSRPEQNVNQQHKQHNTSHFTCSGGAQRRVRGAKPTHIRDLSSAKEQT